MSRSILSKIIFCSFFIIGCGPETEPINDMSNIKQFESRITISDNKSIDGWSYKIIRDNTTEKEWIVAHDSYRMIVMPLDNTEPISVGNK